jgi:hypothetical protein
MPRPRVPLAVTEVRAADGVARVSFGDGGDVEMPLAELRVIAPRLIAEYYVARRRAAA